MTDPVHAVALAVAVDPDGPLVGALILGASGAGKSALALSVIEGCPFRRSSLVADDAVLVDATGERLIASAPGRIAGLIEVRGFGPTLIRTIPAIALRFAVDLAAPVERVAAARSFSLARAAPSIPLYPFAWRGAEWTAAHRLRRIAVAILGGQNPRCTQDGLPEKTKGDE
ncbi:MAG: hypothetical protein KDE05_10690 [Parvularculaceae bacterium]|nr:hypothetical protein [Parvularculaceae bacterium]